MSQNNDNEASISSYSVQQQIHTLFFLQICYQLDYKALISVQQKWTWRIRNKLTLSRGLSRTEGAALPSPALDTNTQTHPPVTTLTTSSTQKPCAVYRVVRVTFIAVWIIPWLWLAPLFCATTSRVKGKAKNRNMLDPLALPHHGPQGWQRNYESYYGESKNASLLIFISQVFATWR